MTAIVVLENVSITRINTQGHMGATVYDGTVTLRAKSERLDFRYTYEFTNSQVNAVGLAANAGAMLKKELEALAVAAANPFQPRA